jgi:hypothetical protein
VRIWCGKCHNTFDSPDDFRAHTAGVGGPKVPRRGRTSTDGGRMGTAPVSAQGARELAEGPGPGAPRSRRPPREGSA